MHVALVNPFAFRLLRGNETLTIELANALIREGVAVTILSERNRPRRQSVQLDPAVALYEVPTFRYFASYTVMPWYTGIFVRSSFDAVVSFFGGYGIGPAYNIARHFLKIPFFIYLGYSYSQSPHQYGEFRKHRLDKSASAILAVSAQTAVEAEAWFDRPVAVLPPGLNTDRLFPDREAGRIFRQGLGIPLEAPVVLSAGALQAGKGMQHVLAMIPELLGQFPNLHYLIAGEGGEELALRSRAVELGIQERTHFLGASWDLRPVYNAADVFCSMSTDEASISGFVTIEAMACGMPAVLVANRPEYVTNFNRWQNSAILLEKPDPDTAAGAISRLLAQPSERMRLGQAGRSLVQDCFNWKVTARELIQLLRSTVPGIE